MTLPCLKPACVLQVSKELLQKYLDLEKNFILKFFLRFAGKSVA